MYTVHCTVLEDLAKTSVSRNCSGQSWGIAPQNRQRVIDTSGEAGKGNGELGPSARHRTMGRKYGVFALVLRYKKNYPCTALLKEIPYCIKPMHSSKIII